MAQGEVTAQSTEAVAVRPPATIVATVVLMILLPLVRLVPDIASGTLFVQRFGEHEFEPWNTLLALFSEFVVIGLVVHGLWRGSRFVWIIGLLLALRDAGFGLFNILLNDYDMSFITNFTQVGFFHGAWPIAVGVAVIVLLLMPSSVRWNSRPQRLVGWGG